MKNLNIRPYRTSDKSKLMELIQVNTPQYFAKREENEYADFLDNHIELYYVVEAAGEIVAGAGINFTDDKKEAFFSWGMVHKNFHGKGIGTAMSQHRLKVLQETEGVEKITLKTSQHTFEFYEKLGFVKGETIKDFWAPGLHFVGMEYKKQH